MERRAGLEFRVAGRTLSGVVMRYGDIAPAQRERFLPGAFAPIPDVPLRLQHDPSMEILPPGAFILKDTERALEIRAELPVGSGAVDLVKRGALSGWSVAFHARAEHHEAGVRVVERAELVEVSLVDEGAYPSSRAEVRARGARGGRLGTIRGSIPTGKRVSCRCSPGDCMEAVFEDGALQGAVEKEELLAISNQFADVVASKRRGGVRVWMNDDGALEYAIDIPNTDRGKGLVDSMKAADIYGRPVLDRELSEVVVEGTVARYQRAEVRAILLNPTDASDGWTPVTMEPMKKRDAPARRRTVLWP